MEKPQLSLEMLSDSLKALARETQSALAMSVVTQFMLTTAIEEAIAPHDRAEFFSRLVERMENPSHPPYLGEAKVLLGASMAAESLRFAAAEIRKRYGLPPAKEREHHS